MRSCIVVHGGAGQVPAEDRRDRLEGCSAAALAGWRCLLQGGSALDMVGEAVAFLEDHPLFNAGKGSALNAAGDVEMDASLMDGQTLNAGAVGAARGIRNPIRLARRIMEDGRHVLLVGEGAHRFAEEVGVATCGAEELVTERQRAQWRASEGGDVGTVGAVAVDRAGEVAAATSTGGLLGKRPGRVGDSALIGAGTYADALLGAASATGSGEAIMRVVLTKTAVEFLAGGRHPLEAAQMAMALLERRGRGEAGIILIDREGRVGHAHNAPFLAAALMDETRTNPMPLG